MTTDRVLVTQGSEQTSSFLTALSKNAFHIIRDNKMEEGSFSLNIGGVLLSGSAANELFGFSNKTGNTLLLGEKGMPFIIEGVVSHLKKISICQR